MHPQHKREDALANLLSVLRTFKIMTPNFGVSAMIRFSTKYKPEPIITKQEESYE